MRVGVVIFPDESWAVTAARWRAVEHLGFDSAWTYDHLWWRALRNRPWYSSVPVMAAAATVTERIRIGALVTSPNFRHPLLVAKETVTLDDLSGGRFTLGIGAGSPSAGDANSMSDEVLSGAARERRYEEFVSLTDRLLRTPNTTFRGEFYSAIETTLHPGCVQRPRVPLALAASGPRGLRLVARYGDAWVTVGPTDHWSQRYEPGDYPKIVSRQAENLRRACDEVGRDFDDIDRMFIAVSGSGDPLRDTGSFTRMAQDYRRVGMTDFIVHWPRLKGIYAGPPDAVERIAEEGLREVHDM